MHLERTLIPTASWLAVAALAHSTLPEWYTLLTIVLAFLLSGSAIGLSKSP